MQIEVSRVPYQKLDSNKKKKRQKKLEKRVNKARKIQLERYKGQEIFSNSELPPALIEKYCKLDSKSKKDFRRCI